MRKKSLIKQTKLTKANRKAQAKKVGNLAQKGPLNELILYNDIIQDPRKIEAIKILALSGYNKDGKIGGAISKAALSAGVNRSTIYHWLEDPEFCKAITEIKNEVLQSAMQGLWRLAHEADFSACAFLAERLDPTMSLEHKRQINRMELLKAQKEAPKELEYAPPTIIIESVMSKDYDRNKLD